MDTIWKIQYLNGTNMCAQYCPVFLMYQKEDALHEKALTLFL